MPSSAFINDGKAQLRRFAGAAAVILAIHVGGGFLALAQWPEDVDDSEPEGAVVMELSMFSVAPPDPQDLAIGPQVEEAQPTPIPTQEAVLEELELPTVEEAPLAPEPDLVLPKVEPVETVKEVDKTDLVQTQERQVAVVNTAAAIATAPPKVDAVPEKTVKAQTVGVKTQPSRAEITWQRSLLLHLNRHKRYPSEARNRRVQGVAKVEFKVDGAGKLVNARIVKGSGSPLLDNEALAMLRRASPFPRPPNAPPSGSFHLALPIEFKIR